MPGPAMRFAAALLHLNWAFTQCPCSVSSYSNAALQCSEIGVSLARIGMALARQQQQRIQQQQGPAGSGHDVPEAMLLSATGLGSNQAGLEVSGVGGAARVGAEHAGGWLHRCETKQTCWGWTARERVHLLGLTCCKYESTYCGRTGNNCCGWTGATWSTPAVIRQGPSSCSCFCCDAGQTSQLLPFSAWVGVTPQAHVWLMQSGRLSVQL